MPRARPPPRHVGAQVHIATPTSVGFNSTGYAADGSVLWSGAADNREGGVLLKGRGVAAAGGRARAVTRPVRCGTLARRHMDGYYIRLGGGEAG